MKEIKQMTEDIKGKQAAYRIQEESHRAGLLIEYWFSIAVVKTHERVSTVNLIEIGAFFLFSVIQIFVIRRWFKSKKAVLG